MPSRTTIFGALTVLTLALNAAPAGLAAPVEQLEGSWAELGKLYVLGNPKAIAFQLDSTLLTITPQTIGEHQLGCKATEKLLRLNFTLQNPTDRDLQVNQTSLKFTVIDAQNASHEEWQVWGVHDTGEVLGMNLKPAEKIACFAVVVTDAVGPVPKLIVEPRTGPVLRYDLRDRMRLTEGYAIDPDDASGCTAMPLVRGERATVYPLQHFALELRGIQLLDEPFAGRTPKAGSTFLIADFTITNLGGRQARFNQSLLDVTAHIGGRPFKKYPAVYWQGTSDVVSEMLPAGGEGNFTVSVEVPAGDANGTVVFYEPADGRAYEFPISGDV